MILDCSELDCPLSGAKRAIFWIRRDSFERVAIFIDAGRGRVFGDNHGKSQDSPLRD
jgi:hypothetical protein